MKDYTKKLLTTRKGLLAGLALLGLKAVPYLESIEGCELTNLARELKYEWGQQLYWEYAWAMKSANAKLNEAWLSEAKERQYPEADAKLLLYPEPVYVKVDKAEESDVA